jgi:selenocysteine-specific elongation factor
VYVVATAGHVDHGKSTLVRALTGMEPDRWAEERRRGMTIDLGYAWTTLPSGRELAFVDVPGHQRFIGNMLAGLGPAPAVLFVVAADEGWRQQSTEHLAAISALGLSHGLLVVTRSDLADPAPAISEAGGRLAASTLTSVEAVAVSGVTGAGLPELQAALDRLVGGLPEPDVAGPVRLWIDRSFSVRGSGTVVTGTLGGGVVSVGDEFVLRDRLVTVRSIQSLGVDATSVSAVARVALNLRGVAQAEVGRSDVLLSPDSWNLTSQLDVRCSALVGELPANLILHVGSAHIPVRARPLGGDIARLTMHQALPLRVGDRAILRDPGVQQIVAGILVLDADPPPLNRRGAAAARAQALSTATGVPDLSAEVGRRGVVRSDHLHRLGIAYRETSTIRPEHGWLVDIGVWQRWVDSLPSAIERFGREHPLDPVVPTESIRQQLNVPDIALMAGLVQSAGLQLTGGGIARSASSLGPAEAAIGELERRLAEQPFAAPDRTTLQELGLGRRELAAAERMGRLVRLSADIVVRPDAIPLAVKLLRELEQPFTASAAGQALGSTRRVVIPLLEYLDQAGLTEQLNDHSRIVID